MGEKEKDDVIKKRGKAPAGRHARDEGAAGKAGNQLNFISTGEARYNELFNHMNSGVAVYEAVDDGEDFVFKDFNPAAEKIERVSRGEVIGRRVTEVFPSIKPFGLFAVFQRVWRSGQAEYFPDSVYRDERDPGSWRESWVYRLQSGEIVAVYNDVTERKLAEHSLRQSEVRMNSILAAMTELVFVLNDEGRFVSYHGSAQELYAGPDTFIGKKYGDVMPPHVNELAADALVKNRAGQACKFDYSLQVPAGLQHYAATMSPIIIDGKYTGSVLVARNITERQQSIEALSASEERFRNMANLLPQTIFEADEKGNFTFVNSQGFKIFGYTEADTAAGINVLQTIIPQDHDRAIEGIMRRISGKQFPPNEYTAITRDGKTFPAVIYATPIIKGSAYAGMRGMLIDITERKQMELDLKNSLGRLHKTLNDTVVTMGAIVEMKDPYTAGHQLQAARLAAAIAQEMGLPEAQVNIIRTTAAIHDIGKIYVPSDILAKPGKLGVLEMSIIRTHAQGSYDILKNIDFGGPVAQIALQHHERLDGSGYPHGLKGEEIMLEARILAISDVVEAMSSHRPYRPSLGIDKALAEIRQNRGTLYDPDAVDACLIIFSRDGFKLD
ncbi:MAG: PAS domain S-box protein [Chloroflexi bacterium]|jgi:PAS domain S-box-containing protein/putative nucleotidyltransferase with HDIG domain|nr:PAS domain S-box protein [Chloroflexota bacterium]